MISTDLLLLRPPVPADAADILVMMTDPDNARWNANAKVVDLPSAVVWCVEAADWSGRTHASFVFVDLVSSRPAGTVAVHSINYLQRDAEIGYRTSPWARGRGYATDAVLAVSAWAFREFDLVRIELAHATPNLASCAVATKAGYQLEGTLRSSYLYGDGVRYDEHLHARLATDE